MANYVQDSVKATAAAGFPGQVADSWFGTDIQTNFAASGGLKPGLAVTFGSTAGVVEYPDGYADLTALKSAGIVVADPSLEGTDILFAEGVAVPVLRKGRVWVTFENPSAAVVNTNPYIRYVAAGAEQKGAFRTDADGSDAAVCTWAVIKSIDELYGQVELDVLLP